MVKIVFAAVSSPDKDVAQGSFTFTVAAAMGSMPMATSLPPLKIISPVGGATVASPVDVVFETTADLSKMTGRSPRPTNRSARCRRSRSP